MELVATYKQHSNDCNCMECDFIFFIFRFSRFSLCYSPLWKNIFIFLTVTSPSQSLDFVAIDVVTIYSILFSFSLLLLVLPSGCVAFPILFSWWWWWRRQRRWNSRAVYILMFRVRYVFPERNRYRRIYNTQQEIVSIFVMVYKQCVCVFVYTYSVECCVYIY